MIGWRAAMTASAGATFRRPGRWPLSLAAFLVRGGIVVIVIPIVIVPTPSGIANAVGPTLTGFVFGGPSPSFIVLVAGIVAATVGWLIVGGLVGAWLEVAAIRAVGAEEGLPLAASRRWLVGRVFVARLLAEVPLAIALAIGAIRIGQATYEELIFPGDARTALVLRVIGRVPDAVLLIVVLWLAGEAIGGRAARRLVAAGSGTIRALGAAAKDLVRPTGLATAILADLAVVVVAVPVVVAAAVTWGRLRIALGGPFSPDGVVGTLLLFVTVWIGGLILIGCATTFRATSCTIDTLRDRGDRPGTVGARSPGQTGEWSDGDGSGTLAAAFGRSPRDGGVGG